jgi:diguanylate cyclase (GGDEF)-like protein
VSARIERVFVFRRKSNRWLFCDIPDSFGRCDRAEALRSSRGTKAWPVLKRDGWIWHPLEIRPNVYQLELAFNNMSQGLVMFDASATITVCDDRYIQMYGLSADVVKPGCTLRELIRHGKEAGSLQNDPERYCAEVLNRIAERRMTSVFIGSVDGLTIRAVERALSDGIWVVTHEDVTEMRRADQQAVHFARHGAPTGLSNRIALRSSLEEASKKRRGKERLAVLYVDLDNFKMINDALGQSAGDELLASAAARLRGCVQEGDMVVRLGGDGFAIVQVNILRRSNAARLAVKIHEFLAIPHDLIGHHAVLKTSVGIAISLDDGTDADRLLENADLALRTIAALATCFQMTTIAEGVDSDERKRRAVPSGRTELLGCRRSHPISAAEIHKLPYSAFAYRSASIC